MEDELGTLVLKKILDDCVNEDAIETKSIEKRIENFYSMLGLKTSHSELYETFSQTIYDKWNFAGRNDIPNEKAMDALYTADQYKSAIIHEIRVELRKQLLDQKEVDNFSDSEKQSQLPSQKM